MKIAIIVSSNIVKDPRVVKQAEVVKTITDDYLVVGKYDENATTERLKGLNFKYKLLKTKAGTTFITKAISRLSFGFKLMKELKRYNPDVIHANDFDMLFFSYFIKRSNQRLIYDAHEIYSKNGLIAKNKLISSIVMKIEKYMLKKVEGFITVSNAAKEYYKKMQYPKEAIVVTNAPIWVEKTSIKKRNRFDVLYQGIISEGRGYEEFAESARYTNNNVSLTIRGYGPSMDKIEEIKEKFNLRHLCIEDPVEMNEMIDKARNSHIGVVMTKPISENYNYTISNKFFEYLHAGLPLILSPVKEHIYLNNKYKVGVIVESITAESIAIAINRLYENKSFYEECRNNVEKTAQIFTWQNESGKLIDLYWGKSYE